MPINPTKIDSDQLYTVEEAAEILGVDEQTIRRYINNKNKKLPAHKGPGGRWFIKGSDLKKILGTR